MIKPITYILLILVLVSCGNEGQKKPKKPDNLIAKDKMVNIIYDMSLLSAAKGVNRKLMEQKGVYPEKYIYTKHNIDSAQFAQSNEYYAFDLDAYAEIYNDVKIKLNKDKKVYSDLDQVESKEKDSINKIKRKTRDSLKEERELNGEKLEDFKLLSKDKTRPNPRGRVKNVDSLKKLRNRQN